MSEWIDIEDEKPLNGQDILMTYNNFVMEGTFKNGKFFHPSICAHTKGYCNCEEQEGITHWMPLPKPPKESNES